MTSRQSSEGSDAIKAAKERLATANAWKKSAEAQKKSADAHKKSADAQKKLAEAQLKSATEGVASAQRQVDSAETQLQASRNQVKDAEEFLKDAYKKWEVIDVDDDRHGVAAASANDNRGKRKRDGAVSPDTAKESKKRGSNAAAAASQSSASNGAPTGEVQEIVVEGAGVAEVNGTYKRCKPGAAIPTIFHFDMDYPVFSRSSLWEGKATNFYLFRWKWGTTWLISECSGTYDLQTYFYYNEVSGNAGLPPQTAWKHYPRIGMPPAPQLK